MLIRYLKQHGPNQPGETADVNASLANKLFWQGIAERVEPETAAIKPATERAVKPVTGIRFGVGPQREKAQK